MSSVRAIGLSHPKEAMCFVSWSFEEWIKVLEIKDAVIRMHVNDATIGLRRRFVDIKRGQVVCATLRLFNNVFGLFYVTILVKTNNHISKIQKAPFCRPYCYNRPTNIKNCGPDFFLLLENLFFPLGDPLKKWGLSFSITQF